MLIGLLLLFFFLLFLGAPVAIAMGFTASLWLFFEPAIPSLVLSQKIYAQTDSFALMAIPFFMFAGQLMERTGITDGIVAFSKSIVGHIRGGLAHTTCITGMLMAGISGSANADASAIGSVMLPALKRNGYDAGFAVAVVASAGALGPIIPPSVFMIIYANATNYSVGKLFMGGVIPGTMMGIGFIIVSYFYAVRRNLPREPFMGFRNIWIAGRRAIWALLMPIIIIGGIMTGIFTATESGVIASVYGLGYGLARRKLNMEALKASLIGAVISSIGPMLIITVSSAFSYMLTRLNASSLVMNLCTTHIKTPLAFFIFIFFIGLIAGCFIDCTATLLMMLPVLLPIVGMMRIDFMHYSLFFILALLTCNITPPVGALLFVVSGISNTPLKLVIRPIMPFVLVMIVVILLIIPFPGIVTWLPSFLGK